MLWQVVEESRRRSGSDLERQADALTSVVSSLSAEDRRTFALGFLAARNEAYDWSLWGAAYVINGGASDDAFDDFIGWLIAQGEDVYRAAIADPETLVDQVMPYDTRAQDFFLSGMDAVVSYGGELGPDAFKAEPSGEDWEEEDLPQLYPKLWAMVESADDRIR